MAVAVGAVDVFARGGKQPVPTRVSGCTGARAGMGARRLHMNRAPLVLSEAVPRLPQLATKLGDGGCGEHGAPVLVPLRSSNADLGVIHVDVLHTEAQALEKPEPGSVHEECGHG